MLRDEYGFEIGYHSWSHRNLKTLSDAEVLQEVLPPFPMCRFAYPYGDVDERVATIVRNAGYQEAWSVTQGDGSQFQRKRRYLNW
jgi:peptidoglycan/xylan/chitin deacetylase (PgdA/CDA1 family)